MNEIPSSPGYDNHNGYEKPNLSTLFAPSTVAVLGASEHPQHRGRQVLWNLLSNPFGGTVYPIHRSQKNVFGVRAYPDITEVPDSIDLAIIAGPSEQVLDDLESCRGASARTAIILSALPASLRQNVEERIRELTGSSQLRVVGPGCAALMIPRTGLNVGEANIMARPGNVAFLSQSGALSSAILDWSLRENVGFSYFVSIESMIDVGWGDLISYVGNDPHTRSIVIHMESIGEARSFLSAAREVAVRKPLILIRPGRSKATAFATSSHTGQAPENDEVLDAVFRRCGILRVDTIAELFYMAEVLAKQPRPRGPRLSIISNAIGPALLATDALLTGGGQLAQLGSETHETVQPLTEALSGADNPIILDSSSPEGYCAAFQSIRKDKQTDGVLVVLTPQSGSQPTQTAERLQELARDYRKPFLASWMGGVEVAAGEAILNRADIPTFAYPDTAARVFNFMWRYNRNLSALYETPSYPSTPEQEKTTKGSARKIIDDARGQGRTLLSRSEAEAVLAAYGIQSRGESDRSQQNGREEDSFELALKSWIDPQFGPVLEVAAGGRSGEIFHDRSLGLPPLNTTLAKRMMERTHVFKAIQDQLQAGSTVSELEKLVTRFSQMIVEQRWIREIRIDPLEITSKGVQAMRSTVHLHGPSVSEEDLPRLAIRPYPNQYVAPWELKDGTRVLIRPIRPEDEPSMVTFHESLSDDSVYLRYLHMINLSERISHSRLAQICFPDYDREMVLVAERQETEETSRGEILGVGRLTRLHGRNEAEFAILIRDDYQGRGLGTELLRRLVEIGRDEKLEKIVADILPENRGMANVSKKIGFDVGWSQRHGTYRAILHL